MTVSTKNGDVYADSFGYLISRIAAFFSNARSIIHDTLEMRREFGRRYGDFE